MSAASGVVVAHAVKSGILRREPERLRQIAPSGRTRREVRDSEAADVGDHRIARIAVAHAVKSGILRRTTGL